MVVKEARITKVMVSKIPIMVGKETLVEVLHHSPKALLPFSSTHKARALESIPTLPEVMGMLYKATNLEVIPKVGIPSQGVLVCRIPFR